MRLAIAFLFMISLVALAGCAASEQRIAESTPPPSQPQTYDTHSTANTSTVDASTTQSTTATSGEAAGQGVLARATNSPQSANFQKVVAQKVSLGQADASGVQSGITDRKIIRNADIAIELN